MQITVFQLGPLGANCYLVIDETAKTCAVVDPGGQGNELADWLSREGLTPKLVLLTHGHYDHVGGVKELAGRYPGLPVYLHPGDTALSPELSRGLFWTDLYEEGDTLTMDSITFRVLHTPGHTPGSVCLQAGDLIRVTDSPIYKAMFEAWGANPTIIAGNEVLTALQQGTIDGCDNVNNVQYADRYYEFSKYISITEHAVHFNGLTINEKLFQSLTPDLQADIMAAAKETAVVRTQALQVENEEQLQLSVDGGAIVNTDVDKEAFIEAAQPVYDDFIANHSAGAYVEKIQNLAK